MSEFCTLSLSFRLEVPNPYRCFMLFFIIESCQYFRSWRTIHCNCNFFPVQGVCWNKYCYFTFFSNWKGGGSNKYIEMLQINLSYPIPRLRLLFKVFFFLSKRGIMKFHNVLWCFKCTLTSCISCIWKKIGKGRFV